MSRSVASALHARTVYRAALALRGETGVSKKLEELRGLENESWDLLEDRQAARLARLIHRTGRDSPFYRDHWSGSPSPGPDEGRAVLQELPMVEKRHLQERSPDMRGRTTGRSAVKRTGGSTAEPVEVRKDADGLVVERAVSWLGYGWMGVQPGERVARFWGIPLTRSKRAAHALADIAMRRIKLSAFELDEESMERHWQRCLRFRPRWLYGYASVIDLFAQHVEARGHAGTDLCLKAVVCTSDPLYPVQKKRIERVFGTPVQDEYGCGETGVIACGCREGLLHVMTESVLVEILKEDGSPAREGETGEVVVTDMNNFTQPLIRYRLMDYASVGGACSCGRPWPTLKAVKGRVYNDLYTPKGNPWYGGKLEYLLVDLHEETGLFGQFQAVQVAADRLEVRLVMEGPVPEGIRSRIAEYAARELEGMRVEVRAVDALERTASGKLRVVRSDWRPSPEEA